LRLNQHFDTTLEIFASKERKKMSYYNNYSNCQPASHYHNSGNPVDSAISPQSRSASVNSSESGLDARQLRRYNSPRPPGNDRLSVQSYNRYRPVHLPASTSAASSQATITPRPQISQRDQADLVNLRKSLLDQLMILNRATAGLEKKPVEKAMQIFKKVEPIFDEAERYAQAIDQQRDKIEDRLRNPVDSEDEHIAEALHKIGLSPAADEARYLEADE
jgi:hypothetical protein